MIVTIVSVYVIEEHVAAFIEATLDNHRESLQEAGNLRFDVLQHRADPTSFTLYEAYETEDAAKKHKETAHYIQWRDTVSPWMAKPREGTPCQVIAPTERSQW